MEIRCAVGGDRDQAEAGMVLTHARDGADAVEAWHVQVDHDSLRRELLDKLDRLEPVAGHSNDRQLRLLVDHRAQGLDEAVVVIRQYDVDPLPGG